MLDGWVKRLLMLYKWLIQPYLSLFWLKLAMHFVTRVMPINEIDGKSYKTEVKSSRNYSTNYIKLKLKLVYSSVSYYQAVIETNGKTIT